MSDENVEPTDLSQEQFTASVGNEIGDDPATQAEAQGAAQVQVPGRKEDRSAALAERGELPAIEGKDGMRLSRKVRRATGESVVDVQEMDLFTRAPGGDQPWGSALVATTSQGERFFLDRGSHLFKLPREGKYLYELTDDIDS